MFREDKMNNQVDMGLLLQAQSVLDRRTDAQLLAAFCAGKVSRAECIEWLQVRGRKAAYPRFAARVTIDPLEGLWAMLT